MIAPFLKIDRHEWDDDTSTLENGIIRALIDDELLQACHLKRM